MPCYFQRDSCKRENSFYTESHARSLKITWHIYLIFHMYRLDTVLLDPHMIYWIIFHNKYMPCYFQYDYCKRENSFYTESHTRSLKITWHIYLIFPMYRLDIVLLDPHMIYPWITFHNKHAMLFSL